MTDSVPLEHVVLGPDDVLIIRASITTAEQAHDLRQALAAVLGDMRRVLVLSAACDLAIERRSVSPDLPATKFDPLNIATWSPPNAPLVPRSDTKPAPPPKD